MSYEQDMPKILDAIKNQRWFFFKNKPKIIFDRDTGLIWANLDYFPHKEYSPEGAKSFIESTNSKGIDGYKKWKCPTPEEFAKLTEDKTFPYCEGDKKRIKDKLDWFVEKNNYSCVAHRDDYPYSSAYIILCSQEIQPKDYDAKNLFEIIKIFIVNNLEPIFNDTEINDIYNQYISRFETIIKLSAIRKQINDWRELKKKFYVGNSLLNYAASIQNLTEYLLNKLLTCKRLGAEIFDELGKISPPNELVPNVESVRAEIERIHDDAIDLEKSLLNSDNLAVLEELNSKQRPPLDLVAEVLTEKVCKVFDGVEFYNFQPNFVRSACDTLNLNLEGFFSNQFYVKDRTAQKVIVNLICYVKAGNLQQGQAENILNHLQSYRYELADLYKGRSDEPTVEEISALIRRFQKNLEEVAPKISDEDERDYVLNLPQRLN